MCFSIKYTLPSQATQISAVGETYKYITITVLHSTVCIDIDSTGTITILLCNVIYGLPECTYYTYTKYGSRL